MAFCYWAGPTQLGNCLLFLQSKPLTESSAVQAGHVIHIGHVQFGHAQRLAVQLGPKEPICVKEVKSQVISVEGI
jgi:hypothetical protein